MPSSAGTVFGGAADLQDLNNGDTSLVEVGAYGAIGLVITKGGSKRLKALVRSEFVENSLGRAGSWLRRRFTKGGQAVIGKLDDIEADKLRSGEHTLRHLDDGDLGSPHANWERNSSSLRAEMRKGVPIRDASVDSRTGALLENTRFLQMERNILALKGWRYNPGTTLWSPPQ